MSMDKDYDTPTVKLLGNFEIVNYLSLIINLHERKTVYISVFRIRRSYICFLNLTHYLSLSYEKSSSKNICY